MFQRSITGSGLKLYINGIPFGIVTEFTWSTNAGRKPLYGIDSVIAYELAPGAQTVSGTIFCNRLHNDGGLEGRGISAPDHYISLEKYIDIVLIDRITGFPVFKADQAAINSQSWSVSGKDLLKGQFQFEAIEWSNESAYSQ